MPLARVMRARARHVLNDLISLATIAYYLAHLGAVVGNGRQGYFYAPFYYKTSSNNYLFLQLHRRGFCTLVLDYRRNWLLSACACSS